MSFIIDHPIITFLGQNLNKDSKVETSSKINTWYNKLFKTKLMYKREWILSEENPNISLLHPLAFSALSSLKSSHRVPLTLGQRHPYQPSCFADPVHLFRAATKAPKAKGTLMMNMPPTTENKKAHKPHMTPPRLKATLPPCRLITTKPKATHQLCAECTSHMMACDPHAPLFQVGFELSATDLRRLVVRVVNGGRRSSKTYFVGGA